MKEAAVGFLIPQTIPIFSKAPLRTTRQLAQWVVMPHSLPSYFQCSPKQIHSKTK